MHRSRVGLLIGAARRGPCQVPSRLSYQALPRVYPNLLPAVFAALPAFGRWGVVGLRSCAEQMLVRSTEQETGGGTLTGYHARGRAS